MEPKQHHATLNSNDVDRHIGRRLREARQAHDWTMAELGQKLRPSITYQQVQKYESGINRLAASRLWEIARLYALPLDYFLPALPAQPPLTRDEQYMLDAFRLLSDTRQQAIKMVIGSMSVGD